MHQLIQEYQGVGLSDPFLETNLQAGNYSDVLLSLWFEGNLSRRLEWLRSKSNELHPVLMFEQAIAEFTAAPTAETVNFISVPLLNAAGFRVSQDALCVREMSLKNGDSADCMHMIYTERLERRMKTLLNLSLERVSLENPEGREAAIKAKVLETAQASRSIDLPSPKWIGWHGMSVLLARKPDMHPASEYKQIRDAYALNQICLGANLPATGSP